MRFHSAVKGTEEIYQLDVSEKELELYLLSEGADPDFGPICLEVIRKIFDGETAYTYLESFHQKNLCKQKRCFYAESFAAGYYRFLKAHSLTENVFFDGDSRIISVLTFKRTCAII